MIDRFGSALDALPSELAEEIRAHATIIRSRRGSDVVAHGDISNQVYLLLQGQVQIRLLTKDGGEAILRDLGPGDFLGDLAARIGAPRAAIARAMC
jgi:CRP-like cAMP-binding protein